MWEGRAPARPLTGKAAFQAARSRRALIENWQHWDWQHFHIGNIPRYPQWRGFCYTTRIGKAGEQAWKAEGVLNGYLDLSVMFFFMPLMLLIAVGSESYGGRFAKAAKIALTAQAFSVSGNSDVVDVVKDLVKTKMSTLQGSKNEKVLAFKNMMDQKAKARFNLSFAQHMKDLETGEKSQYEKDHTRLLVAPKFTIGTQTLTFDSAPPSKRRTTSSRSSSRKT